MKKLNDLSADELGRLFPVVLSPYDPEWHDLFITERTRIVSLFSKEELLMIEHIGSTSIEGMVAKPTVDILLTVQITVQDDLIIKKLKDAGYYFIPKPENPPPHMMFTKGYTPEGISEHTWHIHVRHPGYTDEIIFRDYLRTHSDERIEYTRLKEALAADNKFNRELYTDGKCEFVRKILMKAAGKE